MSLYWHFYLKKSYRILEGQQHLVTKLGMKNMALGVRELYQSIAQGTAAIGGMLIKGINALVDAKRANSFNNAIKMLNANVEITHNRLITLENRTSMMVKAIMPALKDLNFQINKTNE